MLKTVVLLLLIFLQTEATAQNYIWSKSIGGRQNDGGSALTDPAGNVFVFGGFRDTVDFDTGPGVANLVGNLSVTNPNQSIFIAKYDSSGNFIWAKSIANTTYLYFSGTTIDNNGDIILTGSFMGTLDLDPGPGVYSVSSNIYAQSIFILKLDNSGNFVWAETIGGVSTVFIGISVCTDLLNNIYLTGSYKGNNVSFDFDPGPNILTLQTSQTFYGFVAKFTPACQLTWVRTYFSFNFDAFIRGSMVDKYGNIYLTGGFLGIIDLDPGTNAYSFSSTGLGDGFVTKLTPDGNFTWAKVIRGSGYGMVGPIKVNTSQEVIVAGSFQGFADFNPGPAPVSYTANNINYSESFISKYDSLGNFMWVKVISGPDHDAASALELDNNDNIYVSGSFSGATDFDPGPGTYTTASLQKRQAYLLKLNNTGNFVWVKPVSGLDSLCFIYGTNIQRDGRDNFYLSGHYVNGIDINPDMGIVNAISKGGIDVFIVKLGGCRVNVDAGNNALICTGESVTLTANGPYAYTWNSSPLITSSLVVTPTITTAYFLTASLSDDCYKTDSVTVVVDICAGFAKNEISKNQIKIFPNPNNGNFDIVGSQYGLLKIINNLGQLIKTIELIGENDFKISMSSLKTGIYFLVSPKGNAKIIVE